MKKFPLAAGLGLLATCGAVFAAWTFNTTGTTFEEQSKSVTITIDDEVTNTGNHGTLTLSKPTAPELYITQNAANGNSAALKTRTGAGTAESPYAYAAYLGTEKATTTDVFTLTYAPAADEDEPDIYTFKVNWTVSLSSSITGVNIADNSGSLLVSQNSLSTTVSMDTILSRIAFPDTLGTYTAAHEWVEALPAELKINIAFTSVELVRTLEEDGYGYSINNGDIIKLNSTDKDELGHNQYGVAGVILKVGDRIQIHEKSGANFYSFGCNPKGDSGNLAKKLNDNYNYVESAGTYGMYIQIVDEFNKTIWIS